MTNFLLMISRLANSNADSNKIIEVISKLTCIISKEAIAPKNPRQVAMINALLIFSFRNMGAKTSKKSGMVNVVRVAWAIGAMVSP